MLRETTSGADPGLCRRRGGHDGERRRRDGAPAAWCEGPRSKAQTVPAALLTRLDRAMGRCDRATSSTFRPVGNNGTRSIRSGVAPPWARYQ